MKKSLSLSVLVLPILFFIFSFVSRISIAISDECDFSHLSQDVPLLSEYTIEMTEKIKADSGTWHELKKALPNIQRAFASKEPYFLVLLGWAKSWDNFEKFNREQIEAHFTAIADIGKSNAQKKGGEYQFSFSTDNPFTIVGVHDNGTKSNHGGSLVSV